MRKLKQKPIGDGEGASKRAEHDYTRRCGKEPLRK